MIYYEPHRANPSDGIYYQEDVSLRFFQHLHDSFELIYLQDGNLEVTVGRRSFLLNNGEAILIFPNQIHSIHTPHHSVTQLWIFQNSLVGEFYRTVKGLEPNDPVFSITDTTLLNCLAGKKTSRYRLKAYLYEIISIFDEQCKEYVPRNGKSTEVIGHILTFISEHYTEPITIQDIAKEIGYDYHYLSNLLQKGLHTTFRTLLNEYRISHSKYLLLSSDRTISDIAIECGYDSICSFNRNFKEIADTTPSEYRKNNQMNASDFIFIAP